MKIPIRIGLKNLTAEEAQNLFEKVKLWNKIPGITLVGKYARRKCDECGVKIQMDLNNFAKLPKGWTRPDPKKPWEYCENCSKKK
ncbi:MAG: hypothetical protein AABY22_18475 [Nanoarchaeota archaeon]